MNTETKPRPLLHPSSYVLLENLASQKTQTALLAGQPNIGKFKTAEWLAKQVVGSSWHTQAIIIEPNDKNNISIDLIHNAKSFTSYKSSGSADRRVIMIKDAETMTVEAQNSFLKLLEEPPADTYMILTSSQPQRLLETIRSRLSTVELRPPTLEQIISTYPDTDPLLLNKLYLMSGGSYILIDEMLHDREHPVTSMITKAKTLLGQSPYERLLTVDKLSKDKDEADKLLAAATIIMVSLLKTTAKQNKSVKSLLPRLEALLEARQSLRKNHNTKLTLGLLFCRL